jgi:hypothetical protein
MSDAELAEEVWVGVVSALLELLLAGELLVCAERPAEERIRKGTRAERKPLVGIPLNSAPTRKFIKNDT